MLYDSCSIGEGFGYDPAAGAIADARRLGGGRPLQFLAAETIPVGWDDFDVAFSHEVLYLIPDLATHAEAVYGALVPGGSYYAVMGVHAGSPLMVEWQHEHGAELRVPPLPRRRCGCRLVRRGGIRGRGGAVGHRIRTATRRIRPGCWSGSTTTTRRSSSSGSPGPSTAADDVSLRQLRTPPLDDCLPAAFDLFGPAST